MATWWQEAYDDIVNSWRIGAEQTNPDRGAYKDAFQMRAAEKGLDYEITSALLRDNTNNERGMMQLSADLDRRNTLDLMAGETQLKIAGMRESHQLSKDYLAAEGYQQRENFAEQGFQQRENLAEQGFQERSLQNIKEAGETGRTKLKNKSDEDQIRITGDEQRKGIRTEGDEWRRKLAFERSTAYNLAQQGSRR